MNNVTLLGRLARDPELRYAGEMAVCSFTLAVDRQVKDKGADFIKIVVFNRQAENCSKFLTKGKQCAIEGKINTGSYDDKDGKKVYTTDVIANRVEFLGSKSDGEFKQDPTLPQGFAVLDDSEDLIPF